MKGVVSGMVLLAVVATAMARPDRNAFLNEGASNLKELISQTKRDPEVMDRYRRHFGMSNAEVLAYLGSLKPGRLKKDGVYQVYSVPPAGFIKLHAQKFRPGTAVYVDAYGRPAMVALCGNPLSIGPKDTMAVSEDVTTADSPAAEERDIQDSQVDTPMMQETFALKVPTSELPIDPGPLTAGSSPIVVAPVLGAGNLLLGLLGLGTATGGLIGLTQGGGGGDTTVVPEPATMLIAGAGAAYLVRRRRRKQS